MNWQELIYNILMTIVTGVVTTLGAFVINWVRVKISQAKQASQDDRTDRILSNVENLICTTVDVATQTVVSDLKKTNSFDKETAKQVLSDVTEKVLNNLTEESKEAIAEISSMNLKEYVQDQIEAYIAKSKK